MNRLTLRGLLCLAALLTVPLASGCLAQSYCSKVAECASDPPGADFENICAAKYEGGLRALRANKEDECHELAQFQEIYDSCRSQLDCDDFREGDNNGECDDERDDFFDALQDAESECGTLD